MYDAATMIRAANTIALFLSLLFGVCSGCSGAGAKDVYDVRRNGALGDGATDDTAAFQAALTRCAERGGGEVIVPAGNYLIGSVVIGSKTTLRFEQGVTITG